MATAYLSRTAGTPTNSDKWTFSTWVKSAWSSGNEGTLIGTRVDANNYEFVGFDSQPRLRHYLHYSGSASGQLKTTAKYRDYSAWYHVVYVWDSGNADASLRQRMYVNGVELSAFDTDDNATQNQDSLINTSGNTVYIGVSNTADANSFLQGSLAHTHFCDGQAYAASDFGETDSTSGIWVAKTSPSVTYGNNGFFLKYQDTSAFGDDSSGNNNDFTMTGTITQTKDNPDNNFCTWNPLAKDHNETYEFKNGNTICLIPSASGWSGTNGTLSAGAGKWYCEAKCTYTPGAYNTTFGFTSTKLANQKGVYGQIGYGDKGSSVQGWGVSIGVYDTGTLLYSTEGAKEQSTASWTTAWASGDILMFALDIDNGKFYFGRNGTWDSTSSSNPTAGTGGASFLPSGLLYTPVTTVYQEELQINFGNGYFGTTAVTSAEADGDGYGAFEYAPPSGYYALCTQNLKNYG